MKFSNLLRFASSNVMETRERLLQPYDENVTIRQTFPSAEGRSPSVHEKRLSRGRDSAASTCRISQTTRSLCPKPRSPQVYLSKIDISDGCRKDLSNGREQDLFFVEVLLPAMWAGQFVTLNFCGLLTIRFRSRLTTRGQLRGGFAI